MTIYVNTHPKSWGEKDISYTQVVNLAYAPNPPPSGPNVVITVLYRQKDGSKPEGTLGPNDPPTHVKEGMIFTVRATDKS